jgi:hypothetical protein
LRRTVSVFFTDGEPQIPLHRNRAFRLADEPDVGSSRDYSNAFAQAQGHDTSSK